MYVVQLLLCLVSVVAECALCEGCVVREWWEVLVQSNAVLRTVLASGFPYSMLMSVVMPASACLHPIRSP